MRWLAGLLAVVLAGLLLAACVGDGGESGGDEGSKSSDASFSGFPFPAYPGATKFDDGQVLGEDGSEIVHASYSSEDRVEEVLAFYRKRLGEDGFEREGTGGTWRLPAGGEPERTIAVGPPEADVGPPGGGSPPAFADTVIAVSRISRR